MYRLKMYKERTSDRGNQNDISLLKLRLIETISMSENSKLKKWPITHIRRWGHRFVRSQMQTADLCVSYEN